MTLDEVKEICLNFKKHEIIILLPQNSLDGILKELNNYFPNGAVTHSAFGEAVKKEIGEKYHSISIFGKTIHFKII